MTGLSPAMRISNLISVPGGKGVGVLMKIPPLDTSWEWFSMNSSTVALLYRTLRLTILARLSLRVSSVILGPAFAPVPMLPAAGGERPTRGQAWGRFVTPRAHATVAAGERRTCTLPCPRASQGAAARRRFARAH